MKHLRHLFTALLLLLVSVAANAQDFCDDLFCYEITDAENKTVSIWGIRSYSPGDVVIPESVTSNSVTYSVTSIDYEAFADCPGLTSIVIPNSVTSIGEAAFAYCSGLTSIKIPNSVISIGEEAFRDCSALTSIEIPNSVTSIGSYAFYGTAWYNNQPDGVVYAGKLLYEYKGTMPENTSIEVREGTTQICDEAFWNCSRLTSIEIPNSVTSIGKNAFRFCSGLTSIVIPYSVTSIGEEAFWLCSSLETVVNKSALNIVAGSDDYGYVAYYADEVIVSTKNLKKDVYYRLRNVSTGYYMTVELPEGNDMNAGGVQIKSFKNGARNQIFQLEDIEGNNLKIKSVDGYYLASFSYWGYKATEDENASTTHFLAETEEGVYALKGSLGYIGSNNNKDAGNVDGAWVYSNQKEGSDNIYWALERLSFYENKQFTGVPFDYYDSYDDIAEWSYLKFHATYQYYLYYDGTSDVLKTDRNAVDENDKDAYLWAFVGDNINGFKVYNRAAGPNLCLDATSAGAALGTADHLFKVSVSDYAANGFYMQSTNSEYNKDRFNCQDGKVVYWWGADAGSTFMLVEDSPYGELSLLISTAEAKYNALKEKAGTKIGTYSQEAINAFGSRINAAKALKRDEVTKDIIAEFQKFVDTPVTAILPEPGKEYVLKSGLSFAETKAVYNDNGVAKWKTFDEDDMSFYWTLKAVDGGYALQNFADGKYLRGNSGQSGQWSVTENIESNNLLNIEAFANTGGDDDEYAIILAGWQMHAQGHSNGAGSAGDIVSWNENTMNTASAWLVEAADAPASSVVTYVYKYNGKEVATHEKRVREGSEYPEHTYQAPYGVVVEGALPEGNVTENTTKEFVLTVEKELPFEAVAEGEPTKWYYLKMHGNSEESSYIQDASAEDASVEWDDKSFAADEQVSHLWGFVGNLWDGFVVVNKATGKAIKSTGSGAATMVDVADATKFIAWNSSINGGGWFCLKTPAGNFLNGRDGKVQHHGANDNGSSFNAYDASLDFNSPELIPSIPVFSLSSMTILFAREIVVNRPDNTDIDVYANGEKVSHSLNIYSRGLKFDFDNTLTKEAEVTLKFPEGFSITSIAGEEFTAYGKLKFEVKPAFEYVGATPAEEYVKMLKTIKLEFSKNITLSDDVKAVDIKRDDEVVQTVPVENMSVDGNYLTLQLAASIYCPKDKGLDVLNLTIPAGTVKGAKYGEVLNEDLKLEFKLVPLETIEIESLTYNNDGYDITLKFNTEIDVEWGDIKTIPVVDDAGNEVTHIKTERATVEGNILTLYLENAIAADGVYGFRFPNGVVKQNDKEFWGSKYTFDNSPKLLYASHMPAGEVDALKEITVKFTEEIESVADMTLEVKKDGEGVAEIIPDNTEINGAEVVFTLDKEITEGGTYTVELPKELVKGKSGISLFDSKVIEFKVSYKCFDVNVTPSQSDVVNELAEIKIEFNDEIGDIASDAVFNIVDAENNVVTTATASVDGKVVTFVLAKPLVEADIYTLVIAGNVITSVNGACYSGKEFKFEVVAKYYSVTYLVDDNVYHEEGELLRYATVTPPAAPVKEGHTFIRWENLPETMPAEDVVVTAIFEVNSYNVIFMVDDEEYEKVAVEYGAEIFVHVERPVKEGHEFAGWVGIPSSMPAEDVVVTANFNVNSYNVTYMVDGEEYKKVAVEYGTTIELLKAPSKEGYTFVEWQNVPETMPANDVEITAKYEINSYTVTFKVDGKTYESSTFSYGAEIVTPADDPVKEGYTFIDWKNLPSSMPAEDIVITANFKVNSYNVIFMVDGEEYKVVEVEYGARIQSPAAPAKEGHKFAGWEGVPSSMPAEDVVVTANFKVNSYTVTFKVDGKTYKKVTVEYGTEIELPEEPAKVGHTFIGWDELPETMPAENITLNAMFEVDCYTVTFMWGDEVYAEVYVEYGAKIELPENPEVEGHTFISWNSVPRTMPAEDVVVTANFKVNSYIVTFMIDGKVYKTMSVQYGAVIEVPEPTKSGYTFDGWSDVPETMPAENITITGSFTQLETSIDQVLIDSGEVVIYDLNGLRIVDVHELKSGVYIINGKKTVVK